MFTYIVVVSVWISKNRGYMAPLAPKLKRPLHTAPRGVQKSKFKNAAFGLKPSYWMLTIIFEPKNVDTSTSRPQKLTMSKRGFHLEF